MYLPRIVPGRMSFFLCLEAGGFVNVVLAE